jgi:hypothetical protein
MKKLLILTLLCLTACSYSEGDRQGQIVKLSRKGIIFKTWEGELATLARGQVGTLLNNSFAFTITSEDMAKRVQEAMNTGKTVTLHYEQQFFMFPWQGDTSYVITNVSVGQ